MAESWMPFVIISLLMIGFSALTLHSTSSKVILVDNPPPLATYSSYDPYGSLCEIYDYSQSVFDDYPCLKMNITPTTWICLYKQKDDIYVSGAYWKNGVYEVNEVNLIKHHLHNDPSIGLIDIGANIGTYTLSIAAMGHTVVAVEANIDTARRLHKAVKMGGLEHNVILVHNAINKDRNDTSMSTDSKNRGDTVIGQVGGEGRQTVKSILMSDLLDVIPFKRAVMKIDIQSYEHYAFTTAEEMLDQIDVPYIFMEWVEVKWKGHFAAPKEEQAIFNHMLNVLWDRGYEAQTCDITPKALPTAKPIGWPFNVCWQKIDRK